MKIWGTKKARRPERRETISLLCATHHPGPLVAHLFEPLKEVVDEVIIAADSRVGDEELSWYAAVADQLVRFEFTGPNHFRPWLASLAQGDWLLLLDGDETASQALVSAMQTLVKRREICAYKIPIRWVWPDTGNWLDDDPWRDRRFSLVRNDPRITFPGKKHTFTEVRGPYATIDEPIYHLDLICQSLPARQRKVRLYKSQAEGLVTFYGEEINAAYYLPERRNAPHMAPIEAGDRKQILRALTASGFAPRAVPAKGIPLFDKASLDVWRTNRVRASQEYTGDIVIKGVLNKAAAGSMHSLAVVVKNRGGFVWPGIGGVEPLIRLSYRWQQYDKTVVSDGIRTELPHRVIPGEQARIDMVLLLPSAPGTYDLVVDLVDEGVRWFGIDTRIRVDVGPNPWQELRELASTQPQRIVPIEAVRKARALLPDCDTLLRASVAGYDSTSVSLPLNLSGLKFGEWTLSAEALVFLDAEVREGTCGRILEFGSGMSTIVLSQALTQRYGSADGRLLSVDQSEQYGAQTCRLLKERGLGGTVRIAALQSALLPDGGAALTYLFDDDLIAAIRALTPDLVIIDGPSPASGGSRFALPLLLKSVLDRPCRFLVDDGLRDAELVAAEQWNHCAGIEVRGVHLIGHGLIAGIIRPWDDLSKPSESSFF